MFVALGAFRKPWFQQFCERKYLILFLVNQKRRRSKRVTSTMLFFRVNSVILIVPALFPRMIQFCELTSVGPIIFEGISLTENWQHWPIKKTIPPKEQPKNLQLSTVTRVTIAVGVWGDWNWIQESSAPLTVMFVIVQSDSDPKIMRCYRLPYYCSCKQYIPDE